MRLSATFYSQASPEPGGSREPVIDIRSAGIQFRGAPVTFIGEGVSALFRHYGESTETGLGLILCTAKDVEPSGCILKSRALGGMTVWLELFGCTFEHDHHEGGEWSVFLPSER